MWARKLVLGLAEGLVGVDAFGGAERAGAVTAPDSTSTGRSQPTVAQTATVDRQGPIFGDVASKCERLLATLSITATDRLENPSTRRIGDIGTRSSRQVRATPGKAGVLGPMQVNDHQGPRLGVPTGACAQQTIAAAIEVNDPSGVASVTAFNAETQQRVALAQRTGSAS